MTSSPSSWRRSGASPPRTSSPTVRSWPSRTASRASRACSSAPAGACPSTCTPSTYPGMTARICARFPCASATPGCGRRSTLPTPSTSTRTATGSTARSSRTEFGALLVGYYDDGVLRYAGKVGTGFDQPTLRELGARLRELEQHRSPFELFKPIPPGTRWARPELVAQVGFAEWTRDGRLRHPRYIGLREDKPASEVVREVPS